MSELRARRVALMLIVAGVGIRIWGFAAGSPFWLDEAFLVLNFRELGPLQLLGPLDYGQNAPVLWSLLHDAIYSVFGASESALRFPSLVASILSVPLMWWCAQRVVGPRHALIALAVVAFSPFVVWQGLQLKPYSSDLFIALLLLSLALAAATDRRWCRALGPVGLLAIFASMPAVFVLAGIGAVMLLLSLRAEGDPDRRGLFVINAVWLVAGVFNVVVFLQPGGQPEWLYGYWNSGMLEWQGPVHAFRWLGRTVAEAMEDPVGFERAGMLASIPVLVSLTVLLERRQGRVGTFALTVAPILAGLGGAILGVYPFRSRLVLFAVPGFALLFAAGFERLEAWAGRARALIYVGAMGSVSIPLVVLLLWLPSGGLPGASDVPMLISELESRRAIGDVVLVEHAASYAWKVYGGDTDVSETRGPFSTAARRDGLKSALHVLEGERVWVVLARVAPEQVASVVDALKSDLARRDLRLTSSYGWLARTTNDWSVLDELEAGVPARWEITEKVLVHGGALLRLDRFDPEASESSSGPAVGWPDYAGDEGATRWSPLADIDRSNVHRLVEAWRWETNEVPRRATETGETVSPGFFEATPLVFGDTLFVVTPFNRVVALDARRGREHWSFDPGATDYGLIANDHTGFTHRGVASWEGPEGRRILFGSRWELIALDAATGTPVTSFGVEGRVDLSAGQRWSVNRLDMGQTSPPVVWGDIVVVGSAVGDNVIHRRDVPGAVQAFDVRSGERLWRWDPVPPPGTPERETWRDGSGDYTGHANVWAPMSLDSKRGLLYLPVSAASNDWYGGRRLGDNLYAQALVALDVRDGSIVWYQQLVHHDLWDYDLAAAPVLMRLPDPRSTSGTDSVDAVIQATKMGYLFAFDRTDGQPLWPIEERSVPPSDVPGEVAADSQPYPTAPEPFALQGIGYEDLIDLTPRLNRAALERVDRYRLGPIFTPGSVQGTVVRPGWIGGAGWGAVSVDPTAGRVYVKASNLPSLARLVPTGDEVGFRLDPGTPDPSAALTLRLRSSRGRFPWQRIPGPTVPIVNPPWGTLTAIDMATGQHLWQVPAGDRPEVRRHPELVEFGLERTGFAGAPGGLTTAGGLVLLSGGSTVLSAHDVDDGAVLWSTDLGMRGYSNPMTYRASDGRQYVVIAAGFGEGARLQAFVLGAGGRQ